MEHKIKYIIFLAKKTTEAYEDRTCSPYDYPKYRKFTVPVGTVCRRKYKQIISKNCRINDMSKLINSDELFPMNSCEYANLLMELTKNSTSFYDSFSMLSGNNEISIFRLVFYSIQGNYPIIQAMIRNEIEKTYLCDIQEQVKTLKLNFIICNQILKKTNDVAKDWMITDVVEKLETYLGHLRTILTFVYLIVFKKKSSLVNKLVPTVSYKISKIYICAFCKQPEVVCMCFADIDSRSNRNHDHGDVDYFSPETVKNLEHENAPRSLKSIADAETKKSKRDSEDTSTDTD